MDGWDTYTHTQIEKERQTDGWIELDGYIDTNTHTLTD